MTALARGSGRLGHIFICTEEPASYLDRIQEPMYSRDLTQWSVDFLLMYRKLISLIYPFLSIEEAITPIKSATSHAVPALSMTPANASTTGIRTIALSHSKDKNIDTLDSLLRCRAAP